MAKLLVFTVLLSAVAAQIGVHAAAGPYCNMMEMICTDRTSCYNIAGRCDGEKDCADGSDEAGCNALPHTTLGINGTVTVRAQYKSHFQDSDTNAVELLLCSSKGDCSLVSVFGHYYDGSLGYFTWTGCNMWGRECARQNSGSHGFIYDLPSGEVAVQVQRRPTEFVVWPLDNPEDVATVPIEGDHNALMVRTYRMWEFMPVQFS